MNRFKAVIFDMDGVLIDSDMFWTEESVNFFGKRGIPFTKEMKEKIAGNSLKQSVEWAKEKYGLRGSVEELCEESIKSSDHIYTKTSSCMPGAFELISAVKKQGLKLAIASGSPLYRIQTIVDRFGWASYFDQLVSADHVNNVGKPDPAIYFHASEVLKINPADCVVLEDSVNGLRAAQGAGMRCVAVPDPRWSWGDFSKADLIAKTLNDEKIKKFIGLI